MENPNRGQKKQPVQMLVLRTPLGPAQQMVATYYGSRGPEICRRAADSAVLRRL